MKQGKQKHRTEWVLGKVGLGKKERKLRSAKEALQETQRPRNPAGKVKDLRHYFEAKGKNLGSSLEPDREEEQDPAPTLGQDGGKAPHRRTKQKEPTGE